MVGNPHFFLWNCFLMYKIYSLATQNNSLFKPVAMYFNLMLYKITHLACSVTEGDEAKIFQGQRVFFSKLKINNYRNIFVFGNKISGRTRKI